MRAPSRHAPPSWMRPKSERLSSTITALVVMQAILWAAYVSIAPLRSFIDEHLLLSPDKVAGGEVWQVATALFFHAEGLPIGLFFDLLGLWFVGATIERDLGRRRFLLIFFVSALAANALRTGLWLAFDHHPPASWGCGVGVMALFVAFGKLYNRTPVSVFGRLVLEARFLVLLLIGFSLISALMRDDAFVQVAGDVTGWVIGYVLAGGRGAGLRELWNRLRSASARRRFQVVEGGRKKSDRRSTHLN